MTAIPFREIIDNVLPQGVMLWIMVILLVLSLVFPKRKFFLILSILWVFPLYYVTIAMSTNNVLEALLVALVMIGLQITYEMRERG